MERLQREATESSDAIQRKDKDVQAKGVANQAPVSHDASVQMKGGGNAGAWDADASLMGAFGMDGGAVQAKADAPILESHAASVATSYGGDAGKTSAAPIQMKATDVVAPKEEDLHKTAQAGVSESGGQLPHLDKIQKSFGPGHDVSAVRAHTGAKAEQAADSMGAEAYATGNDVAFGEGNPSLHTAAHEAAHVVQQRAGAVSLKGGVGESGDVYEQHADAVADRVVQGKSAGNLLSQMAPGGGSTSGGGGVQRKALQFDIKSDIREKFHWYGNDNDGIFQRLQQASVPELQALTFDNAFMAEMRSNMSMSNMERVLDLISAPLAQKLRLAISGWLTNDNDYIRRSLDRASPAELVAAGGDTALVNQLVDTLGSGILKSCLDRMSVPLARKIEWAISGWGADQAYVNQSIATASIGDVNALVANTALMAKLDAEGWSGFRGLIARRIFPSGGGTADDAFKALDSADEATMDARLFDFGGIEQQRTLCDGVIIAGLDTNRVKHAFRAYWHVELRDAPAVAATTNGGDNGAPSPAVAARSWDIPRLQFIHTELKRLPDHDSRNRQWRVLALTNEPSLINRAAYGGANNDTFSVGSNASTTPNTMSTGYSVRLAAPVTAVPAPTITVDEPARFKVGDTLAVGLGTPNQDTFNVTAIAGSTYTLSTPLAHTHANGELVQPTDGSGVRPSTWLAATVRHEIAHSLDGGGIDTHPFYAKGDWVLGSGDGGFDVWAAAMGSVAWTTNDASVITSADRGLIKAVIVDCVQNRKGSLYAQGLAATHPIMVNQTKNVGVMVAAETCLLLGDQFYNSPASMYAASGKRFTISWWYRRFQHHNEAVVSDRVANYGLYAPTEFFAEAYTVFYEEAGRTPPINDADYGRLIRNSDWRNWIRDNVHKRGLAPAGTGAVVTAPGATPDPNAGAHPGGATTGRASGNPGM